VASPQLRERGRYLDPSLYDAPEEQSVIPGPPIAEAEAVEEEIDELRRLEEEQRRAMDELRRRMERQEEPPAGEHVAVLA
jgi:hypothetical protein